MTGRHEASARRFDGSRGPDGRRRLMGLACGGVLALALIAVGALGIAELGDGDYRALSDIGAGVMGVDILILFSVGCWITADRGVLFLIVGPGLAATGILYMMSGVYDPTMHGSPRDDHTVVGVVLLGLSMLAFVGAFKDLRDRLFNQR